ncbi:uncharacterized protein [Palaemon carinicauda]|uniref:uncharacterized protein n=1 Tax=Palaemon carinicauda TaxID=392227 RepID=UPI0035B5BC98
MTVAQYAAKFDELSRFAPHMVSTESLKARKFERGLKSGIQAKVFLWRCPTYAEILEKALFAEQNFNEWKKQQSGKSEAKVKRTSSQSVPPKASHKQNSSGGSSSSKFKGRCRICNRFGHKAFQCKKKANNPEQKNTKAILPAVPAVAVPVNIKCFKCGKLGHYANKCTQPPQQQQNRPPQAASTACAGTGLCSHPWRSFNYHRCGGRYAS